MFEHKPSRKVREAFSEGLAAFVLGLTIASLVGPLPAGAADLPAPSKTVQNDPKLWKQSLAEDEKIVHLLNRITFGLRPGDIEKVREMGIKKFLDEQFHPEGIDDSALEAKLAALPTLTMDTEKLLDEFKEQKPAVKKEEPKPAAQATAAQTVAMNTPPPKPEPPPRPSVMTLPGPQRVMSELAREEVWRAVYSERQLQEVMVQFWMNHFNIFAPKGADRWLLTSFERDSIRPHAMGKFEDLLRATSESPAMLFYLDNWMSTSPTPNYAPLNNQKDHKKRADRRNPPKPPANPQQPRRGLNENYGRELMELHTMGVDGGYTQKDVIEVARCFTGWTIERPQQRGAFMFNPKMHDYDRKVVLGHKIKAGRGMEDGLAVLHLLAGHRSTAHFISLKLCRRFIADDPPQSAVDRVAKTFVKTHGDIRRVLNTILTSPEFYSQAAFRAKVKSPLELVASSLRALGGNTDADLPILQSIQRMGQQMFQYEAPTGFPDREATWINSGTLLTRVNFALTLAANRVPGTEINLQAFARPDSPEAIVDQMARQVVGGVLAPETKQAILRRIAAANAVGPNNVKPALIVSTIAGLLLASPEFQRR